MNKSKFRNRLLFFREKRALSQEELANKVGISRNTVVRIERDVTKCPHPSTRQRIANILEIDVGEIFRTNAS